MPTIYIEFLGEIPIYLAFGIQTVFALVLGGLIGFDREEKMKSAGIKTNMLICLGAMIYTTMSLIKFHAEDAPADPNRVAAQIVSGIGFLGAGAIIQGRGNIIGLTTAATIWVVASIGFTVGAGYPIVASLFTITILVVLRYLGFFVRLLETEKYDRTYHMEVLTRGDAKEPILRFIDAESAIESYSESIVDDVKDLRLLTVNVITNKRRIPTYESEISQLVRVRQVKFLEIKES